MNAPSAFFRSRRTLVLALSTLWACGAREGGQDATFPLADPVVVGAFGDASSSAPRPSDAETGGGVPYDRAIHKSTHNAYAKFEPLFDQLVWHGIRSVELDIHTGKSGRAATGGDWFVYHEDYPLMRSSSCQRLSDCLGQLRAFHDAVPEHEPVTLWVDLKGAFDDAHRPADLDELLVARLGQGAIVTPADLMARCPDASTLRASVTRQGCAFPTMAELRGKFVVAITGGADCDAAAPRALRAYRESQVPSPKAFVAPTIDARCPARAYDTRGDVVFLNMSFEHRAEARAVRDRGLVARVFGGRVRGGLNTASDFAAAWRSGAQHLATDRVNADKARWSSTGPFGSPVTSTPGTFELRASTGDLWNQADSAWFSYVEDPGDATYQTFVSVPSSHAEPFAKACLSARADTSPDAPNVAVCRTFDNHPPRMQVRSARGRATTSTELRGIGGLSSESPAFFRLSLTSSGRATNVITEVSHDGIRWQALGGARVEEELPLRGWSLSSHGPVEARAVFGPMVRSHAGASVTLTPPMARGIGDDVRGRGAPLVVTERRR